MKNKKFWGLLAIALLIVVSWTIVRSYESYQFDKYAEGHIQRAANANTVELAKQEMETALNYIKSKRLTSGSTYMIFNTPDKDIGFWYTNLNSSLDELDKVKPDATQLEKTNLLMKLRESITSTGDKGGSYVIVPPGISIYPHNLLFAIWGWIGFLLLGFWCGWGIKKAMTF